MSVIYFPIANPRHAASGERPRSANKRQEPARQLDVDEIEALTARDFFHCIRVDAETGTATLERDDESLLVQYLEFHGLRLPRPVAANQILELCNDLRWSFGQAVRCAARGGHDIGRAFPGLNALKMAYVLAVANQDHIKARDLARQVFTDRAMAIFLY